MIEELCTYLLGISTAFFILGIVYNLFLKRLVEGVIFNGIGLALFVAELILKQFR